jgi:hypothetical protein
MLGLANMSGTWDSGHGTPCEPALNTIHALVRLDGCVGEVSTCREGDSKDDLTHYLVA